MFGGVYDGCKVLVTGHTGFKGGWLSHWLCDLGAKVAGYAQRPTTSLFQQLKLGKRLSIQKIGDVCRPKPLQNLISSFQPDVVFHLAAQSLVRTGYHFPVMTYASNVMGTVNLLDALRTTGKPCQVVIITSDKCYRNDELGNPYVETDALGGHDPYSCSKACIELITESYKQAFLAPLGISIATARAGNVIGGGDWGDDRLVPDCVRATRNGTPVAIRNKYSTRPWQHVLEPLSGYLWLGAVLSRPELLGLSSTIGLCEPFNFGPTIHGVKTVEELVKRLAIYLPGIVVETGPDGPHEAAKLSLSIEKAEERLQWIPTWNFDDMVQQTALWYKSERDDMTALTSDQIALYYDAAHDAEIAWAN